MDSGRATKGGTDNLFELNQACRSSGVTIRGGLTARELQGVDAAVSGLIGPQGDA
jgi:hypothetical protein